MHFVAFIVVSHLSLGLAWVGQNSRLDLLWPPPQAEKEVVVNSVTVSPAEVSGDSGFPCAHLPIPDNVDRLDFPIVGGQIEFNLTVLGASSTVPLDGDFMVNYHFGQFDNNMTISQDNSVLVDYWYWNATDFRADLGSFCTPTYGPLGDYAINLTKSVYDYPYEVAYLPDLEGMNATFGAELVVFGEAGSDTQAIMNVVSSGFDK